MFDHLKTWRYQNLWISDKNILSRAFGLIFILSIFRIMLVRMGPKRKRTKQLLAAAAKRGARNSVRTFPNTNLMLLFCLHNWLLTYTDILQLVMDLDFISKWGSPARIVTLHHMQRTYGDPLDQSVLLVESCGLQNSHFSCLHTHPEASCFSRSLSAVPYYYHTLCGHFKCCSYVNFS